MLTHDKQSKRSIQKEAMLYLLMDAWINTLLNLWDVYCLLFGPVQGSFVFTLLIFVQLLVFSMERLTQWQ